MQTVSSIDDWKDTNLHKLGIMKIIFFPGSKITSDTKIARGTIFPFWRRPRALSKFERPRGEIDVIPLSGRGLF